jgi:hypothetical protein
LTSAGTVQLVWLGAITVFAPISRWTAAGESQSHIGPPKACVAEDVHHTMSVASPPRPSLALNAQA